MSNRPHIRNLAIIAHVDHGKTTLVDGLLKETGSYAAHEEVIERALDSGDLERERGITINSKNTAVFYKDVRINLVDTPGHADFGGEVERVMGMVDGVLLVVDAVEGVMPQTRFVMGKAIAQGHKPVLVVNKIDRPERRVDAVVDEVFDLLVELGATDDMLDFPIVYASAKAGFATRSIDGPRENFLPLLDTILESIPAPACDPDGPAQFQAVTLGYDEYLGRLVIGRVKRGVLRRGETVVRIGADGERVSFKITKLFGSKGLKRIELTEGIAGDIVTIAGVNHIEVGDTVCAPNAVEALPRIAIDPPTLRVVFTVNTSPFAGREGKFVTSRQIGDRLAKEQLGNVAISVAPGESGESFEVAGRGELQIGVLIETMRREGYEFAVGRPEIILKEVDGRMCEPVEEVVADVPELASGIVIEKLNQRKATLSRMETHGDRVLIHFSAPSRGLFGYRTQFLTDTRGEGILHRRVTGYAPHVGALPSRKVGAVVASEEGDATAYSIFKIQERATLFVGAGDKVYEGQVIGEARKEGDLVVNIVRAKQLTNVRAAGKDEALILTPPRRPEIETALGWIQEDELLEVTPRSLRLRKRERNEAMRKRLARSGK